MGGHILEKVALELAQKYGLKYFVETGTWKGGTTVWAAEHFEKVWTIEADKSYFDRATAVLKTRSITMLHGDSGSILGDVLKEVPGPALLWLDAHWCRPQEFAGHPDYGQCPILEELSQVIADGRRHVLMIDDARLFMGQLPPECDPAKWPCYSAIEKICQSWKIYVKQDVIIGEPK